MRESGALVPCQGSPMEAPLWVLASHCHCPASHPAAQPDEPHKRNSLTEMKSSVLGIPPPEMLLVPNTRLELAYFVVRSFRLEGP